MVYNIDANEVRECLCELGYDNIAEHQLKQFVSGKLQTV